MAVLGGFQTPVLSPAVTSPLRCGRLAFHIQLPFSFLHFPYVEAAIRSSHIKDFCGNCSLYHNTTQEVRAGMLAGAGIRSVLRHCISAKAILSPCWGWALGWQLPSDVFERESDERCGIRALK